MKFLNHFLSVTVILALLTGIGLMSCSEDSNDEQKGTLRVIMSDAPFPGDLVESANVTITKIEIRKSGNYTEEEQNQGEDQSEGGQDNGNPYITLSEEEMSMNLLELRNGVTESLAELEIQEGSYDLIRLYIGEAGITLTNGDSYDLDVPSGSQTGLKVFIDPVIEVAGGLTAELLLDFDVSQSFVARGNINTPAGINGFIFKPVIRATNNSTAGRITGTVTDTADAIGNAHVWVTKDTTVAGTFTEASGAYSILGVPEGTYDVHATKSGYDTISVSGVEVVAGNKTEQSFQLSPLE